MKDKRCGRIRREDGYGTCPPLPINPSWHNSYVAFSSSGRIIIHLHHAHHHNDDAYMQTIDSMRQDILFALAPC